MPQTPCERALDLLRRLCEGGAWYHSAIELSGAQEIDGEDAYDEALTILADAGVTTSARQEKA